MGSEAQITKGQTMSYKHFTLEDRDVIQEMKLKGMKDSQIADILGCHRSSVGREVKRNSRAVGYISHLAQKSADERRWFSKPRPKQDVKKLHAYVVKKLKKRGHQNKFQIG